ncbi:hypothetical protein GP2143_03223 [marine gamma proteobacterium HTCC2143]|uniref:HNH domain-containing protein n=1 Tax=marine gamma proteobacterium HTCC2143 TaxID=247633 RepID=A0YCZ6_9GAMM|nr:hypothetical protein GP2143_03223 [marine gamma proteobacterium HTCC2143]
MSTFLLTWSPDKWGYENLQEYLDARKSEEFVQRWSSGRTKKIPIGSRVFLTKQGKGNKGIFGSGHVTKEPAEEPHFNEEQLKLGKKALFVMVNFDQLYDPQSEIPITHSELQAFDSKVWDSQSSGITIPEETASKLEQLWLERTGAVEISYADEVPKDNSLKEGAAKKIWVNAYERNPDARERCIRKWGLNCVVCNFHFEQCYGHLGKRYIHVHHLKPLAEIQKEYEVNPEEDLRPVCPNCHSMLHRNKNSVLSIEELQTLVNMYSR